ncbi:MAG: hypothetical protein AABX32_03425 [Nanoarchaeota archaeon]
MPRAKPLTEQEVLVLGTMLAQDSLAEHLCRRNGKMYFLTDHLFTVSADEKQPGEWRNYNAVSITRNMQGTPIPDGLDAFIERIRKEQGFTGIVPLTGGAIRAVEAKGLRPTLRGAILSPEEVSYDAYR